MVWISHVHVIVSHSSLSRICQMEGVSAIVGTIVHVGRGWGKMIGDVGSGKEVGEVDGIGRGCGTLLWWTARM